ncbi:MAG: hypothetical protein CYPHOPRED_001511 [Cyphobasidiales sp. Tagirdzhanova-0007]|nr:MAG: hypothetical protein CYPHOPRED_001511 [Cyphobasidiales sp. Tagirdzhanova-0007]
MADEPGGDSPLPYRLPTTTSPFRMQISGVDDHRQPSKGKGRELGINLIETAKKRKLEDLEPTNSLLHRLAGPSTGKAGLKRNPEEVRQVIYQSSRGGQYFKNEERKDVELTAQIHASLEKLKESIAIRGGNLQTEEKKADRIVWEQEARRDLSQTIVVVDCDAFYASVEELDDPSLKGRAFGVGEGVLTTASYEARKYGCRSAMPGYIAKKLCPELIFVKPDFTKYSSASSKVMAVLTRYDADLSPASLDEAYMNLTPYLRRTGLSAGAAVQQMREEVKHETGLTVSAGCGPNTLLAKIAADVNKPDGQCIIEPTAEACRKFMLDLSVRKIHGIGRVTERWLEALEIYTCQDIYTLRGKLLLAKGEIGATSLLRAYLGISNNAVERGKREDRRGVGHETTFSTLWRPKDLSNKLREIADSLGGDLARLKYSGRTLTLKLKLETYEVLSRAKTIDGAFSNAEQLYRFGHHLLDSEMIARATAYDQGKPYKGKGRDLRLRLMGLKVSNLKDESEEAARKKVGLHKWAIKPAPTRAPLVKGGSTDDLNSITNIGPANLIDLTGLDDSIEEEEGDFEEIFLEAAPCSICKKTFPFADDIYNLHVQTCRRQDDVVPDMAQSAQDLDHESMSILPLSPLTSELPSKRKPRHDREDAFLSDCSIAPSIKQNAFAKMMKKAKERTYP